MTPYHSASISFHGATAIKAFAGGTQGAPLSIECHSDIPGFAIGEVTIFLDDFDLAHRIADAINAASRPVAKIEEAA